MFHHKKPVGSLKKISLDEIYCIPKCRLIVQPKIDGVNITLRYKNGRLIGAGTSGNGVIGKDVTHHFLHLTQSFDDGDYTGEAYIPHQRRATVAGIINRKELTRDSDKLVFQCHELIPIIHTSHGITVADIQSAMECSLKFDYDTDGVVIKVAQPELRNCYGVNPSYIPKWAWAIKHPVDTYKSVIIDIFESVGPTGRVTPIVVIDPIITKSGVTIQRINCYSVDTFREMKIKIGDDVLVQLKGNTTPIIISKNRH